MIAGRDGGIAYARQRAERRRAADNKRMAAAKIPTLKTIEEVMKLAEEMPLYARWQTQDKTLPKFSRNHATGTTEPGLSVNGLSGKSEETFIGNITEYQGISGNKLLFVTGEEIATGSDGEPIIVNARIVARGSPKLMEAADQYKQEKRCRQLIARGDIAMARFFGCPGV